MGLFDGVKNFLSPVKLEIQCPSTFSTAAGTIQGRLKITSEGSQQIDEVVVVLVEHHCREDEDGKHETSEVLGTTRICSSPFKLTGNEQRTFDFSLSLNVAPHGSNRSGGFSWLGAAVAVASLLVDDSDIYSGSSEQLSYELVAAADVLGSKFDPKCGKSIRRVD